MLAIREYSCQELRQKLSQRRVDPLLLEQVLEQLQQAGLQSDERFTESFIDIRIRKGQGPVRIRRELQERGVDDGLISRFLAIYDGEWRELLQQVHDTKFGQGPASDNKELIKRARFLEYRGFADEMIQSFLFD
jgi:regulatory protein